MSINCKRSILMLCALLFGGTPATMAQQVHGENKAPFDTHEYHDFQPFAPAQLSEYGNGPAPNEGWFFSYERMHLSASAPEYAEIGDPSMAGPRYFDFGQYAGRQIPMPFENGSSNAYLSSEAGYANRYEFGYMVDNSGWAISIVSRLRQSQVSNLQGAAVLFNDPYNMLDGFIDLNGDGFADDLNGNGIFGNDGIDTTGNGLPNEAFAPDLGDAVYIVPTFDQLKVRNLLEMSSGEVMKTWRYDTLHHGGVFEWGFGLRYLEIDDSFYMRGGIRDGYVGGPLAGGILNATKVRHKWDNHILGPQFSMKWSRRTGRWTLGAEGRVATGINFRSARQNGMIATEFFRFGEDTTNGLNLPLATSRNTFNNRFRDEEFSPIVELRLDGRYQLTKAASIKFGWTGIFVDSIGRASNTVVYTMPGMGIRDPGYGENIFVQGVNVGFEFNR